ncbi:MAG: sulfatase-like hydrolase/transferase [Deltaproteobacteria bacterium]|nr:sulfatase-like hydrolase/transferase [Deltaproteobacteria bacterium]
MSRPAPDPAASSHLREVVIAVVLVQLVPILELVCGWVSPALGQPVRLGDALVEGLGLAALAALLYALPAGPRLLPALVAGALLGLSAERLGWPPLLGVLIALPLAALPPRLGLVFACLCAVIPPQLTPRAPELGPPPARRESPPPDLALITLDTLRADHLGALPGEGWWVFDQAISAAPWTLPAMDSLMLGEPVRRHGGGLPIDGGFTRPSPTTPVLAERLSGLGMRAAAFVSNPHLRASFGFDRGFQRFDHSDAWEEPHAAWALWGLVGWRALGWPPRLWARRDPLLVNAALRWWAEAGDAQRFLWVHLMSPHEYRRDPALSNPALEKEDPERLRRAYAEASARGWAEATRLIEGLGPQTRIVLVADHGESLGEEGRWGHGSALIDPQLHVPLAARGFGEGPSGGQVAVAALADALVRGALGSLSAEVVEVGGLRRDASGFGLRIAGGSYSARPPPAPAADPAEMAVQGELLEALHAIGYVPGP